MNEKMNDKEINTIKIQRERTVAIVTKKDLSIEAGLSYV